METRKYKVFKVIFAEDVIESQNQRFIYQVKSGAVDIYTNYKQPGEKKLTTLQPGAYFGEIALLQLCPHSATAVAADDCEINLVTAKEYQEAVKANPSLVSDMVMNIGGRIRSLTNDYMEVCKTIKEYGANRSVGEKSGSLWKRLFKFSNIYTKNGKFQAEDKAEFDRGIHTAWLADNSVMFDKNEVIFKEGDESHCMYDIIGGEIGIYSAYGMKDQKLLTKLQPNQFFGEIGLISNDARSATAVALKIGTTVDRITLKDLEKYVTTKPEKVDSLMNYLAGRLRALTIDYLNACKTAASVIRAAEESKDLEIEEWELVRFYSEMDLIARYY